MKKILLIFTLLASLTTLQAQWAQKANHGGGPRGLCAAFSIGDKIYVFGGSTTTSNVYDELWEYNTLTNVWTQKADFPGGNRVASTAFAIGNKGYVGMGSDFVTYYNDFWEYNPATDIWLQKANFPAAGRQSATGLAIGNKGYVCSGLTYMGTFTLYNDLWEYDPTLDSWLQKTSIPGPARSDVAACAIGGIGYLGLGTNKSINSYNDFYTYNPASDTWTPLSNPPDSFTGASAMFTIGTDCYLVGGHDWSNNTTTSATRKYSTTTDTWTSIPFYQGGPVYYHVAASVNGKGYVGTGGDASLVPKKDWFQYTVPVTATVTSIAGMNEDQRSLAIYPNPFHDNITVSFADATTDYYTLSIKDVLGREVFSTSIDNAGSPDHTIQLPADLSSGIYSFLLSGPGHTGITSGKIMKE